MTMMMTVRSWMAALALIAVSYGAVSLVAVNHGAQADVLRSDAVSGWQVSAIADNGRFARCIANIRQPDGVDMFFTLNRTYNWELAFGHSSWILMKGTRYDVAFVIDNSQPMVAQAVAIHPNVVSIRLAENGALFDAFRRGRLLRLAVNGRVYNYALYGTAAMLPALTQCVRNGVSPPAAVAMPRANPPASDLFAAAPPAAPVRPAEPAARERTVSDRQVAGREITGGDVTNREDRPASGRIARATPDRDPAEPRDGAFQAEATVLMANVLSQSGITGFTLSAVDVAAKYHADASWSAGDLVGFLQVVPDMPINDPNVRGMVIGIMAKECKGAFLSGTLPEDNNQRVRMFTSCQDDGKAVTSYFSVIARPKGGIYIFSTLALDAKDAFSSQEKVKEADDGLRQAVYRVVK
jgi:hypothetical protein